MNRAWLQMSGVVVATATLTIGCGLGPLGLKQPQTSGSARTSGPVSLQFLQNKPEVVREWNQLINRFHAQNPNITIKQINPPNTDTALQADVAKGQVPDIIAMGADATFITMAKNGVFHSFAGSASLTKVSGAYGTMLENEVGSNTPYAIPYTVNAVPVLYNQTLFNQYHLKVPTTWNQFIAEARQVKAAGGTPFYNGFKDAWTIGVPWNALAANEEGNQFFGNLKSGKASFSKDLTVSATRMKQLVALGQPGQFGVDYNDANTGFAKGKSVFYVQGIWTLPVIRQTNPKILVRSFVFPATNSPRQTKMVSGVDSLLTVANSGNTAKTDAAIRFIDFLLQPKQAAEYAKVAGLFATVKGVQPTDPAVASLQTYVSQGRVIDFPDHYYPPAMAAGNQYQSILQGTLSKNQSAQSLLQQLDALYKQSAAHQ